MSWPLRFLPPSITVAFPLPGIRVAPCEAVYQSLSSPGQRSQCIVRVKGQESDISCRKKGRHSTRDLIRVTGPRLLTSKLLPVSTGRRTAQECLTCPRPRQDICWNTRAQVHQQRAPRSSYPRPRTSACRLLRAQRRPTTRQWYWHAGVLPSAAHCAKMATSSRASEESERSDARTPYGARALADYERGDLIAHAIGVEQPRTGSYGQSQAATVRSSSAEPWEQQFRLSSTFRKADHPSRTYPRL